MDVDFEGEKLFRCGNEEGGCGVTSCRKCKKLDHLPKSCEEVEADKKLDARHLVEEAMSEWHANVDFRLVSIEIEDIMADLFVSASVDEELSEMQERCDFSS